MFLTSDGVNGFMTSSTMVWFKPTKKLFDFFLQPEWKWRRYHDCGAGMGRFTRAMLLKGIECTAYDRYPRDEATFPVRQFDTSKIADEMDLSDVALLARPCHDTGFIEATIHSALEMGEAFYIGVPRNIERDLIQFEHYVVAEDVGQDGEVLIRIRCDIDKHYIRRKIKNYLGNEEWWWYHPVRRRYTSEPTGMAGFNAEEGDNITVLAEEHWASDLQLLDKKADICRDDSPHGWLAPDGEWFGCGYAQHDYVARAVLGCSVKRLEQIGFCRCHEDERRRYYVQSETSRLKRPTSKQRAVLKAKGFENLY